MKSILLAFTLLLSVTANAQDVLDSIAIETCKCLDDFDLNNIDSEKFTMQIGLCMIEKAMPYSDHLEREFEIDFKNIDGADGEKLGQLVGIRMATTCPDKLMAFANMDTEDSEIVTNSINGILKDILTEGFNIISIEDDSGRQYSLLWLSYFENSYDLLKRKKDILGKKVSISYEEIELFDPKINEYRKFKIIKAFSFDS